MIVDRKFKKFIEWIIALLISPKLPINLHTDNPIPVIANLAIQEPLIWIHTPINIILNNSK